MPQHAEEGVECVLGLVHSYCAARYEPTGASESQLRRSSAWSDGSLAAQQRADSVVWRRAEIFRGQWVGLIGLWATTLSI